jgi:tRNA(Ile)-lysidine synthase
VLDGLAAELLVTARDGAALELAPLAGVPAALRRRVLRGWLHAEGVRTVTDSQLRESDVLAVEGPDRGGVALPGGLELVRGHGRLTLRPLQWSRASAPLPRKDGHRVRR